MNSTTTLASINPLDAAMHQDTPCVDKDDEVMAALLFAYTNEDWEGVGEPSALAKESKSLRATSRYPSCNNC